MINWQEKNRERQKIRSRVEEEKKNSSDIPVSIRNNLYNSPIEGIIAFEKQILKIEPNLKAKNCWDNSVTHGIKI